MKNKTTLLLLLLLSIKIICFAQQQDLAFRHITTENGLSFNYTWCELKDDKGFMWFGTRYGLNRFDGTHIKTYYGNPDDSLSLYNSEVYSLQIDHFGTIWILTDGGLCYLNTNQGNIIHRMSAAKGLLKKANGIKIYIDQAQHLWLFTGAAFCEYNITDTGKIKLLRSIKPLYDDDVYVNVFAEDNKGNMYCSTDFAFYKINKTAKNVIEIKVPSKMNGVTQSSDAVKRTASIVRYALCENDTTVWLGMYNVSGLVSYNPCNGNFVSYRYKINTGESSNMIRKIYRDKNPDNLWVGTFDDGLYVFNTKIKKFIAHYSQNDYLLQSLASNNVKDVMIDEQGILWVATAGGICYENPHEPLPQQVKAPFATGVEYNDVISGIEQDQEYQYNHILWISVFGGGLIKFNDSSFQFRRINLFSSIGGICKDQNNSKYLWIAAQKGLKHVDTRTLHIADINIGMNSLEKINGLYRVSSYSDGITIANGSGFSVYMRNAGTSTIKLLFKIDTTLHSNSQTVLTTRDKESKIYVYTNVGQVFLSRIDPVTNITEHILAPGKNNYSLPDVSLVNVYAVSRNNLLLVYPNSIYTLNLVTKKTSRINLPLLENENTWYTSCIDSSGIIWLLSPKLAAGITAEGKLLYTQQINIGNNLFSGQPYVHNGIMYIGQVGYYFYLNIDQLKKIRPLLPAVKIISLKILEKEQPLIYEKDQLKNYNLTYHQNIISFEFSALNYATPSTNHYEYKLEGFNKNWIDCGTRTTATFTNLDGGYYTFEVKAANGNGAFSNAVASLSFYVSPPFYNTWWFITLCILAIFGAAYFVLYVRQRQALQVLRIRNRIARDLHDDVGSALSSISLFSDVINKNLKTGDEQTSSLAARIGDNARQVIESMSDIIWAVKPSNETVADMLIRMKQLCSNLFESKEIAFQFEADEKVSSIKIPMSYRRDMYLIFKEAVNNIVKYSACKNVMIKMFAKDSLLQLLISDDGIGFDTAATTNGNGLQNMKARAAAMQGSVSLESKLNKGTIIQLVVPIP